MKKATVFIALALLVLALLGGCRTGTTVPTASPNVPIVSESPAIPSPVITTSPEVSPKETPSAKPSPEATK